MGRRRSAKPKRVIAPHVFQKSEFTAYLKRIDQVDHDIAELRVDRKQILQEMAAKGYHPKLVSRVVAERRKDGEKFSAEAECLDLYRDAAGVLSNTPLGDWIEKQSAANAPKTKTKTKASPGTMEATA